MTPLLASILTLVIYAVILAIVWWGMGRIAWRHPFQIVARVVFAVICILVILDIFFGIGLGLPKLK